MNVILQNSWCFEQQGRRLCATMRVLYKYRETTTTTKGAKPFSIRSLLPPFSAVYIWKGWRTFYFVFWEFRSLGTRAHSNSQQRENHVISRYIGMGTHGDAATYGVLCILCCVYARIGWKWWTCGMVIRRKYVWKWNSKIEKINYNSILVLPFQSVAGQVQSPPRVVRNSWILLLLSCVMSLFFCFDLSITSKNKHKIVL
jgi:hypothetical protein